METSLETSGVLQIQFRQADGVIDPTIGVPDGNGVYGLQEKGYDRPELLAPSQEAAGGFLFIPGDAPLELVDQLVSVAGLASEHRRRNQYAVQVIDAPEGMESELGYMRKLVIADRFALRHLYHSINDSEYNRMPEQPLDIAGVVKLFLEDERKKYGTLFGSAGLAGKFGGDGNLAQEALGFGFAIENSYHGVISVWSRGWLCTK